VFRGDYQGERIAVFHSKEYAIYRTYLKLDEDSIELYLEEKAGAD